MVSISQPALMLFPVNLDQERVKQFDAATRAKLTSLEEETDRRRREQIDTFRANGAHVWIVEMPATSHYCFVHRPREVIRAMRTFLVPVSGYLRGGIASGPPRSAASARRQVENRTAGVPIRAGAVSPLVRG